MRSRIGFKYRMLTPQETATLRAILAREAAPPTEGPDAIAPGDVVEIRPTADRTYGGMLALITQAKPHQVRAILLRPHRGGCREAWLTLSPPEVAKIGASNHQAPAFATRCEVRTPACTYKP